MRGRESVLLTTMIKQSQLISIVSAQEQTMLYFALAMTLLVIVVIFYKQNEQAIDIIVSSKKLLADGSYYLRWGYNNKTGKPIHVDQSESSLVVTRGGALLLSKRPPHHFRKGKDLNAMEMIVLDGSEVEWFIKDNKKKVYVSSNEIKEKGDVITNE